MGSVSPPAGSIKCQTRKATITTTKYVALKELVGNQKNQQYTVFATQPNFIPSINNYNNNHTTNHTDQQLIEIFT